MNNLTSFYRKCLKIRGDLERAAERAAFGDKPRRRLEMNEALTIYKDVPSFFAIAEKESHGWYKRPIWASERYGAK